MNFIDERAYFFDICESIFLNIENNIILTFIFGIKCSNHDFLLNCFFQRIVRINVININNDSLKMILHSLINEE